MSDVDCNGSHIPGGWLCFDPDMPSVIVSTGRRSRMVFWLDSATAIDGLEVDPIERSMLVAQFRAIADRLEAGSA